ncbi:hypothetical protein C1645_838452 [Glomus cerebriforme]|uniref:Uncharacterized protein n=1 Tax=Glomus cerebriforme TaxID=658196 RepID=A0A397S2E4_9GLOM|nr:hypothetical protein C1645_838452 [Glomus cerebriforme]
MLLSASKVSKLLGFQLVHFSVGTGRAKYNLLDFSQDTEFIMSYPYLEIMLSPPPLPPLQPPSPPPPQISASVSISRDPNCVPYWNDQVVNWSKKLLLLTEIGCVSSPLTILNLFSSLIT